MDPQVAEHSLQQRQLAAAMLAAGIESKLIRPILECRVSVVTLMWNRGCTLAKVALIIDRATIQATLGSQATAGWQRRVKGEVDLDNLDGHALLDLAESPLMLNPLREIQQWARMDDLLGLMTKYQLRLNHSQAAAKMALLLVSKPADLMLNQYPTVRLGPLVVLGNPLRRLRGASPRLTMRRGYREHPDVLGRMRAPSRRARPIGRALMSNQYFADSERRMKPDNAGSCASFTCDGGTLEQPPCSEPSELLESHQQSWSW